MNKKAISCRREFVKFFTILQLARAMGVAYEANETVDLINWELDDLLKENLYYSIEEIVQDMRERIDDKVERMEQDDTCHIK